MKRRLVVGAAAALVAGLLVVAITVGVNVDNGKYGQAGTIVSSALKDNGQVSAIAARLRKVHGVAKIIQVFAPLHLPDPAATIAVTMKSGATSADVLTVTRSASQAWSRDRMRSDLLTLTVKAGAMSVHVSKFLASVHTLQQQLGVWDALRSHTPVSLVGNITDSPPDSAQALTIATASGTVGAGRSVAEAYATAFRSTAGMAAGPSWKLPGITGTDALPPTPVLALFSASAHRLPVAEQNDDYFTSGISLRWNGGSQPFAHLYISYISTGHPFATAAAHVSEASLLAKALVASGISGMNFAYEAFNKGSIVQYDFYTGACGGRAIPTTEKTDDLSLLGLTVAQLNGGAPGQCLPPT